MCIVCNQVAPVAEQHVQWGSQQRRRMPSKKEKPNINPHVEKSMEDCYVLASVSGPSRIITRPRTALLKIDENEPVLVDSSVDNKVSYIATLYVFLEGCPFMH